MATRQRNNRTGKAQCLRYAAYLRCSTDEQAQGEFSTIVAQEQATATYIMSRLREGDTMLPAYMDEGVSGTFFNRPGVDRLIADAEAGLVDVVVVTFMSRLGRGDAFTILEHLLKRAGARVETVKESFADDIGGYFQKTATRMMDGMYPVMVSGWVKLKQQEMVAKGHWPGGPIPFGTKTVPTGEEVNPRRLVMDEETQPLLLRAFEMWVETGRLTETRDYLRSVSSGRVWSLTAVGNCLSNETYRGVLQWGVNRREDGHEPIIPVELWDAAQERLRAQKAIPNDRSAGYECRRDDPVLPYYLRGRVYCVVCGCRMTTKHATGRTGPVGYYECTGASKAMPCPVQRINADALHRTILTEIAQAGAHPTRLEYFIRETVRSLPPPMKMREVVQAARKVEQTHQRSLRRLTQAITAGAGSVGAIVSEMRRVEAALGEAILRRVEAEKMALQAEAARPDAKNIAALWAKVTELWEAMQEAERREVMAGVVESVHMTGKREGELRLKMDAPLTSPPLVGSRIGDKRLPVLDSNQRHPD